MIVPILIDLNLYMGPLLWMMLLFASPPPSPDDAEVQTLSDGLLTVGILRSFQLLTVLAVTTAQRYHLFVLTVFSPKVLYEVNTSLVFAIFSTIVYVFTKCAPNDAKIHPE